jgi:hypothetical protein
MCGIKPLVSFQAWDSLSSVTNEAGPVSFEVGNTSLLNHFLGRVNK